MATILKTESIYFNDINMLPRPGVVKSRKDVPDERWRVIVSPMLAVVGITFIKEAASLGLSVATPRYISVEEKIKLQSIFNENRVNKNQLCFTSIGLNEDKDTLIRLSDYKNILVDIANGYVPQLRESIHKMAMLFGRINNLMVGNVVTAAGIHKIVEDASDYTAVNLFIRVGIGNGSPCSSSDVAAVNRGQVTELLECREAKEFYKNEEKIQLVSDGGISKSGFAVKAFACGGDYVLMGGYFSKALEAETHISGDGDYFGCASSKQIKLAGLNKTSEGKEFPVDKKDLRPLKDLVSDLWGGIASGVSYSGYKSVSGLIGNGILEKKCNSLPPKNRK